MSEKSIVSYAIEKPSQRAGSRISRFARDALIRRLESLEYGVIEIVDPHLTRSFGSITPECDLSVRILVDDPRFYTNIAFGGSLGAGESYIDGYWRCSDLTTLVRILLINRHVLDGVDSNWRFFTAPVRRMLHWFNRNTLAGSRNNIAAHYDIGNDLFELMLDPKMMYSSAVFEYDGQSLDDAASHKLDLICRKLDLQPDDHVIEIGTGWGGFAIHAAKHFGCRVTTTTISKEQYELAKKRVFDAGLGDRINLLLSDYRELTGEYDKLVSIEMIEAVGHDHLDEFFGVCSRLLKKDGLMVLQAITIADQQYDRARRTVDYIKKYVFPGSCIPSVTRMNNAVCAATDMRLVHLEDIGPHYATTLRLWRDKYFANIRKVRQLGYPQAFDRLWEFYLCYCEGGFLERAISDVHMVIAKPDNRREPLSTNG